MPFECPAMPGALHAPPYLYLPTYVTMRVKISHSDARAAALLWRQFFQSKQEMQQWS